MFAENDTREIESRESYEPKDSTAWYQFFDIEYINDGGREYNSGEINGSKVHYVSARLLSLEDVEKEQGIGSTLHSNMRINGYSFVVEDKHKRYSRMYKSADEIVLV